MAVAGSFCQYLRALLEVMDDTTTATSGDPVGIDVDPGLRCSGASVLESAALGLSQHAVDRTDSETDRNGGGVAFRVCFGTTGALRG